MNYTTYLPTPVYSSDKLPLMPCHPARARILLRNGRAVPHHTKGIFGIRMLDRTREESEVQEIDLHIDQGSRTTGIAVTTDVPANPTPYPNRHSKYADADYPGEPLPF